VQICSRVALDLRAFELLSQLLNRKSLEPFMSIPRVVASASPVDAKKPRQTVHAEFAMKNAQGVLLELLIRHLLQRNHRPAPVSIFTGFNTRTPVPKPLPT
jgi:hypothetical protein